MLQVTFCYPNHLDAISLKFRSTFRSTKHTSLEANLAPKSFSEPAPWYRWYKKLNIKNDIIVVVLLLCVSDTTHSFGQSICSEYILRNKTLAQGRNESIHENDM